MRVGWEIEKKRQIVEYKEKNQTNKQTKTQINSRDCYVKEACSSTEWGISVSVICKVVVVSPPYFAITFYA